MSEPTPKAIAAAEEPARVEFYDARRRAIAFTLDLFAEQARREALEEAAKEIEPYYPAGDLLAQQIRELAEPCLRRGRHHRSNRRSDESPVVQSPS